MEKTLKGFNSTFQKVDRRYSWINDMIDLRQKLMARYMRLLEASAEQCTPEGIRDDITKFCDQLIDYVSHGHFDLYPRILELIENASGRSLSIARRALPNIEHTSDFLMSFNDRYCQNITPAKVKTLKRDLGEAGKCLETRFRNEDRLIVGLRLVHAAVDTLPNAAGA
ncbi:MAG: Rsd/AlgQ family anti-sigma factor [Aeromonadales bacterium]|nr:Rsd/AlgQ family anti-sigma factor [Aeromonadales bacterium]MDY2890624.1 Rsd/AlgQ family anti-sigma factor [Succinivibrio sp.]